MSLNIVSFKAPKFKPMPGELTPAVINGATLPAKVETAKRAIAACCDLSELLTWKDKLAALAAAAKMARMPEMARDVNRVHKEAIFRMGEILLTYKGENVDVKRGAGNGAGKAKSERVKVGISVGLKPVMVTHLTRIAESPKSVRDEILANDKVNANPQRMVQLAPSRRPSRMKDSDAARVILSGGRLGETHGGQLGLNGAARVLRALPLELLPQLTPEEKRRARKLVVEMQEILDDIDQRLGPDTGVNS